MSRGKKLGVLCGILAAVILTLVLVSRLPGQRDKEEGTEILTIPTDKITSVSWEYAGEKLHFAKHGDVWVCPEQDTFPVDSALLETMMGQLESIRSGSCSSYSVGFGRQRICSAIWK